MGRLASAEVAVILPALNEAENLRRLLPELLALMRERLGSLVILPIQPKAGSDANRVIVQGRKGKRAPARLLAPLVLHEADGRYAAVAQHLLRDGGSLDL